LRYCYLDADGNESPTLRVNPGDLVILKLKNEGSASSSSAKHSGGAEVSGCESPIGQTIEGQTIVKQTMDMQAESTNLYFHGLMIPPTCHADEVIKTNILSQAAPFEYRFRIPLRQPPGLYWYHPHPHGHSEEQVLGGASGALIVEGIENFNFQVAALPERLIVIRDQTRISTKISPVNPIPPSKDLSVNFVPVLYPDYAPAVIRTKPMQRELWRVLNAAADTSIDLRLLMDGKWQSMGLVSVDGVPLGYGGNGKNGQVEWRQDIPIPPGGRAEFLFNSPALGADMRLLTSGIDTAPDREDEPNFAALRSPAPSSAVPPQDVMSIPDDDDYTPPRWIAKIVAATGAAETTSVIPRPSSHLHRQVLPPLTAPHFVPHTVRARKLYFSEKVMDQKNPRTSTIFYITEEGHEPAAFDPSAPPNITVRQGGVEDWVIENRSQEIHTFHIHQTHFLLLERDGNAVDEPYLRDGVAVPYWDGVSKEYPSVKIRIDFRDPEIIGTFPYHCHILQHEDGGMMGTIQVVSAK